MVQQHDSGRNLGLPQQSDTGSKYIVYPADGAVAMGMESHVNKSAGVLTSGECVVDDLTNARGVTTSTTAGDLRTVYVVPKIRDTSGNLSNLTIAVDDEDWLYGPGAYVPAADLDATAVSIHEYLKHSGTAKKLTGTGVIASGTTPPPVGSCAIAQAAKGAGAGQIAVTLIQTEGGIGGRAMATTAPTQGQLIGYNGTTWLPVGGMYLIEDQEKGADGATFDFQTIPQTFKHLKIIGTGRSSDAGTGIALYLRFNNDSGNNYDYGIYFYNGAFTAVQAAAQNIIFMGDVSGGGAPANDFASYVIDIPDYTDTAKLHKTISHITAREGAAANTNLQFTGGGSYRTTGAISRVTLSLFAGNFVAGSRASLYGIG